MSDWGTRIATGTVRFERLLPGPLERVWDFLVKAEKRALWLSGGEDVPLAAGAEFDMFFLHASLSSRAVPIPERFQFMEKGVTTRHRVIAIDPPRMLAISWPSGEGEEPSEARFRLEPRGDMVRLTITHSGIAPRSEAHVGGGWHTHLGILADRMDGRDTEPFWESFEQVEQHYTDAFAKE